LRYFDHGQFRAVTEQPSQRAGVAGVEMLDEHERHPGIVREGIQQLAKRLEASGRSSYPDHRARRSGRRFGVAGDVTRGPWAGIVPGGLSFWGFIRLGHEVTSSGRGDRKPS
jgi:hypothetical protein